MLLLPPVHSHHPACCLFPAPQVALVTNKIFNNVISNALKEEVSKYQVRGCQVEHHSPTVVATSACQQAC
jgi:hypothetical protein